MGAQPQARVYEMRDILIKGLLLRVHPSGHKAWVVEWGRGRRKTLGALSQLSLEAARAAAAGAMAEALKNGSPGIAKPKQQDIDLGAYLKAHYGPWARTQLKWGAGVEDRLRTAFRGFLGRRLHEFDPWLIDRWQRERLTTVSKKTGNPVGKSTIGREIAALRSALNKAVEWDFVGQNPLLALKVKVGESRKVVRFLSAEEEYRLRQSLVDRDKRLIAARASGNAWSAARKRPLRPEIPQDGFGDHLTPVVLVAMNTGLRRGELLSLRWSDIDLGMGGLTVRAESAKSGKPRHVPLNSEALRLLTQWRRQASSGEQVFPIADVKTAWRSLMHRANIEKFRFHDLRHHFASKLVMRSVDLNTVRELLGHSDLKMTLRYAHLAPAHLAEAVSRLNE